MQFSYLMLEIKPGFNLLDDEDLQYIMPFIQSQIHHMVINYQHRMRKMYGS